MKPIIGILMGAEVDISNTKVPLYIRLEILFTKLFLPYLELLATKTDRIKKICENYNIQGEMITIPWGININDSKKNNLINNKLKNKKKIISSIKRMVNFYLAEQLLENQISLI